jgi:hypothetical protein
MATVFWGEKGIIPLKILPRATTVNCDRYPETLDILNARIRLRWVHHGKKIINYNPQCERQRAHKTTCFWSLHTIWNGSLVANTMQSWPCTITFTSVWSFKIHPVRTSSPLKAKHQWLRGKESNWINVLLTVHYSVSVSWNQHDALFIQFIKH